MKFLMAKPRSGQIAAERLKALSGPFLNWAGKAERLSFDVPTLPLFVHERLSTKASSKRSRGTSATGSYSFDLFGDPGHSITDQVLRPTSIATSG